MLEAVSQNADEFLCVTPDSPRALSAEKLSKTAASLGYRATAFKNTNDAIEAALKKNLGIIAFGSLYMAGDVRKYCREIFKEV